MPVRIRRDVDSQQGHLALHWYERAVTEMRRLPATDPTSWAFQAGIHGYDNTRPPWKNIPNVPPLPIQRKYWMQCQHGSWFFLPWHRMYLANFEAIVAAFVRNLGGPPGWALPYWDYSSPAKQSNVMPAAFTSPQKGNGAPNALYEANRRAVSVARRHVRLGALKNAIFSLPTHIPQTFGGIETQFSHAGTHHGALETEPHDLVHVDIGGYMGIPTTAAYDPIFWLHHANIDRLWEVWRSNPKHRDPTAPGWLNFPFDFLDQGGNALTLSPMMVLNTTQTLHGYVYSNIPTRIRPAAGPASLAAKAREVVERSRAMSSTELIGQATNLPLSNGIGTVVINLNPRSRHKTARAVNEGAAHTYLEFAQIVGKGSPSALDIYINLPPGPIGQSSEGHYAGAIPLFGLEQASQVSDSHPGGGLTHVIDISELESTFKAIGQWNNHILTVTLIPAREHPDGVAVKIGAIKVHRG